MPYRKWRPIKRVLCALFQDVDLVPPRLQGWWTAYLAYHALRYALTVRALPSPKTRILEIGSVPGHLTVLLKQLGHEVIGVDLAPTRIAPLWKKYEIEVVKVDVEQEPLPFETGSFDIVLMLEVLEHLRINPLRALKEARRVLKGEGRLILSTPRITPIHRLLFLLGKSYQGDPAVEFERLEWLGHMGHIRLYEVREIRRLLNRAGFVIESCGYRGKSISPHRLQARIARILDWALFLFWPLIFFRCRPAQQVASGGECVNLHLKLLN